MSSRDPIKVLHVINSLDTGGAEQVVKNYALRLDRRRFRVAVCALKSGGDIVTELCRAQTPVHLLGKSSRGDFSVLSKLATIIRAELPDLIHVHDDMANNWTLFTLGFKRSVPLIRTVHNLYRPATSLYLRAHQIFSRLMYRNNSCLICCSEAARQALSLKSVPRQNMVTIHNGIDLSNFAHQERSADSLKSDNGSELSSGGYRVGTIGGLRSEKGHQYFLRAAQILKQTGCQAHFYLVGEGDNRRQLEQLSRRLQVQDIVHFLGYRSDVRHLLAEFHLVVFPSITEGLPIAVLEALAMRRPVIASEVGGIPEAIKHGKTGWLVPPADAGAMAKAIAEALSHPEERQRRAEQGFQRVATTFTLQAMIRATEELYEFVLNEYTKKLNSHVRDSWYRP